MEEGYEQVYGIVSRRPGKSFIRKLNSRLFYKIVNKFSDSLIPENVSDFRLVDKKVVNAVKSLDEVNRFYRGFFSWVGFKSIGIEFERQKDFLKISCKNYTCIKFCNKGSFSFFNQAFKSFNCFYPSDVNFVYHHSYLSNI